MKFTLINHEELTEEIIDTPLTLKQWMSIHFGAWGFYNITQTNKKEYEITDKFSDKLAYTIRGGK